ncbi:Heterokaryon incompatibility protein (HET) domain containing protein [Rhypophila sp. PSN 637]
MSFPGRSTRWTVGDVIGASTSKQPDVRLAKKWIQDCRDKHPHHRCSAFTDVPLSTRVLDVRPSPGLNHVRLVLTNRSQGRYITLSYRWGDPSKMPIKLTQDTLERLRNGISVDSLPRTFQDAVTVTRNLGYRYLWIDSLCILQDSVEDWQKAVIEMPDIYNHAELNICGPAAADCTAGFLHDRKLSPESKAVHVSWRISQGRSRQTLRLIYRGYLPDSGEPPHSEPNSALATRGWILQERLLSQRMLYFGSRNMYWECNTYSSYETLHFPLSNESKLRNEVAKMSFNKPSSGGPNAPTFGWRWTWYEMLGTYSTMDLSFQTDKLVAISAMAQRFSGVLQDEYLAGLWRSELFKGLSWDVNPMQPQKHALPKPPTAHSPSPYIAPSWSWASSTMKTDHHNATRTWVHNPGETAEIVAIAVTPVSNDNPYGSIVPGSSITLCSPSFEVRITLRPFDINILGESDHFKHLKRWKAYHRSHREEHHSSEDIELGTFFPDHEFQGADDATHELICLPIGLFSEKKKGSMTLQSTPASAFALVVEKIPGEQADKYRRRGLLFDEGLAIYGVKDERVLLRRLLQTNRRELGLFEIV